MNTDFENDSLEEILKKIQGLSSVGTSDQIASIMAVPAKCTQLICEQIQAFNKSTSRLTKVLIVLNIILAAATVVGAIAAIRGVR